MSNGVKSKRSFSIVLSGNDEYDDEDAEDICTAIRPSAQTLERCQAVEDNVSQMFSMIQGSIVEHS